MTNNEKLKQHLQQAYGCFLQLDQSEQLEALDRTLLLMQKMLRGGSGQKQRLAELGLNDSAARSASERSRAELPRKSNAASQKNELRR